MINSICNELKIKFDSPNASVLEELCSTDTEVLNDEFEYLNNNDADLERENSLKLELAEITSDCIRMHQEYLDLKVKSEGLSEQIDVIRRNRVQVTCSDNEVRIRRDEIMNLFPLQDGLTQFLESRDVLLEELLPAPSAMGMKICFLVDSKKENLHELKEYMHNVPVRATLLCSINESEFDSKEFEKLFSDLKNFDLILLRKGEGKDIFVSFEDCGLSGYDYLFVTKNVSGLKMFLESEDRIRRVFGYLQNFPDLMKLVSDEDESCFVLRNSKENIGASFEAVITHNSIYEANRSIDENGGESKLGRMLAEAAKICLKNNFKAVIFSDNNMLKEGTDKANSELEIEKLPCNIGQLNLAGCFTSDDIKQIMKTWYVGNLHYYFEHTIGVQIPSIYKLVNIRIPQQYNYIERLLDGKWERLLAYASEIREVIKPDKEKNGIVLISEQPCVKAAYAIQKLTGKPICYYTNNTFAELKYMSDKIGETEMAGENDEIIELKKRLEEYENLFSAMEEEKQELIKNEKTNDECWERKLNTADIRNRLMVKNLQNQMSMLKHENNTLKVANAALKESMSWKVTKPLRDVYDYVYGKRN